MIWHVQNENFILDSTWIFMKVFDLFHKYLIPKIETMGTFRRLAAVTNSWSGMYIMKTSFSILREFLWKVVCVNSLFVCYFVLLFSWLTEYPYLPWSPQRSSTIEGNIATLGGQEGRCYIYWLFWRSSSLGGGDSIGSPDGVWNGTREHVCVTPI
jgi:hypothetical protein